MAIGTIVTAIASSTVVTGALAFALRALFEHKLKIRLERSLEELRNENALAHQNLLQHNAAEIETLKAHLSVLTDNIQSVNERKLGIYPGIVELVYRLRNLARGIAEENGPSRALANEFRRRLNELENTLYVSRFDLEKGQVFQDVHAYKNLCISFVVNLSNQESGHMRNMERLNEIYKELDIACGQLVAKLAAI